MSDSLILGADIGGSHITAGLVDISKRKVSKNSILRRKVDSNGSVADIIQNWSSVIKEIFQNAKIKPGKMGVAMPGPFNYEEGISYIKGLNKYEALYGLNIKELLSSAVGVESSEIIFVNDAPCFLQGEVFVGSAKNYDHAIGITLGTGFGTAIFHHDLATDAELWQAPFKDSIAEHYFSTEWFLNQYRSKFNKEVENVKELAVLAVNDSKSLNIFEEFGKNLAIFLENVITQEKPQILICGGNISKAFNLFGPSLNHQLRKQNILIEVKPAVLGEQSALIGAASSWSSKDINYLLGESKSSVL